MKGKNIFNIVVYTDKIRDISPIIANVNDLSVCGLLLEKAP